MPRAHETNRESARVYLHDRSLVVGGINPSFYHVSMALTLENNDEEPYQMGDSLPQRYVTVAVNYEASVDPFLSSQQQIQSSSDLVVERSALNAQVNPTSISFVDNFLSAEEDHKIVSSMNSSVIFQSPERARRSVRGRTKDPYPSRVRVRYDMQLVPPVRRHTAFLDRFPMWWLQEKGRIESKGTTTTNTTLAPFAEDTSVLWRPADRTQWEDTVSEMTALCTSAAIRRHKAMRTTSKTFHAPLSRDYIRDRVDIDDPLNGYQVRHKTGGWLQGFIIWTNFTTWTHNFHWDSRHPMSGFYADTHGNTKVDADGLLAQALEAEHRSGNPLVEGVIFPSIAEIGLVGGIGCGEYLLRMALEDIRSANSYKFVVLQATDQSKTFYERFGFVRVGAHCQYRLPSKDGLMEETVSPVMGYRHWTHSDESEKSLNMHGGPSYMMCLRIPFTPVDSRATCEAQKTNQSFMDAMKSLFVKVKPTIEQLGASFTPALKMHRRNSSTTASVSSDTGSIRKKSPRDPGRKHALTEDQSKPSSKRGKRNHSTESSARAPLRRQPRLLPDDQNDGADDVRFVGRSKSVGRKSARLNLNNDLASESSTAKVCGNTCYSVRGNNGRFVTIPPVVRNKPVSLPPTPVRRTPLRRGVNRSIGRSRNDGESKPIDNAVLMKQKVKSYPRSRVHYYNRVVKPKNGSRNYFFVLHFDESSNIDPHCADGSSRTPYRQTRGSSAVPSRCGRRRRQLLICPSLGLSGCSRNYGDENARCFKRGMGCGRLKHMV
jgi:hypothetical protein